MSFDKKIFFLKLGGLWEFPVMTFVLFSTATDRHCNFKYKHKDKFFLVKVFELLTGFQNVQMFNVIRLIRQFQIKTQG